MATSNYRRGAIVRLEGEPIFEPIVLANDIIVSGEQLLLQPLDQHTTLDASVYLGIDGILFPGDVSFSADYLVFTAVSVQGNLSFEGDVEILSGALFDADGELLITGEITALSGNMLSIPEGEVSFDGDCTIVQTNEIACEGVFPLDGTTSLIAGNVLALSGELALEGDADLLGSSTIQLSGELTFEGVIFLMPAEVGTGYTTVVINTMTGAISEYDFAFDSFCDNEGSILAAGSDGIYLLSGTTDNGTPIECQVALPTVDTWKGGKKIPTDLYLTYRSDGDVQAEIVYGEDDEEKTFIEILAGEPEPMTRMGERKVDLPRGRRDERYMMLRIRNVMGSTLELKDASFVGQTIRRAR